MNAPEKLPLADIQAHADERSMAIDRVGVRGIRHPIGFERTDGSTLPTVATIDMYVGLPSDLRGTHMSRFLEVLQETAGRVSLAGLRTLMTTMLDRLGASRGHIEMRFPYFVVKRAPVSGVASLMDYEVTLRIEVGDERCCETVLKVLVPVTSLCPCSKEISAYGAHNQRSHVTIEAVVTGDVAVNFESIHSHSAYALVGRDGRA
jgi:GTP cyclohydrolase I